MPLPVSPRDPRHPQYHWRRMIRKNWRDLDPARVRRFDHLAARLHSALGTRWELRREEGGYAVAEARNANVLARLALWKDGQLLVGYPAGKAGAYEAAAEMSPTLLGLWVEQPTVKFIFAALPDEGQTDEIVLGVEGFIHGALTLHPK